MSKTYPKDVLDHVSKRKAIENISKTYHRRFLRVSKTYPKHINIVSWGYPSQEKRPKSIKNIENQTKNVLWAQHGIQRVSDTYRKRIMKSRRNSTVSNTYRKHIKNVSWTRDGIRRVSKMYRKHIENVLWEATHR